MSKSLDPLRIVAGVAAMLLWRESLATLRPRVLPVGAIAWTFVLAHVTAGLPRPPDRTLIVSTESNDWSIVGTCQCQVMFMHVPLVLQNLASRWWIFVFFNTFEQRNLLLHLSFFFYSANRWWSHGDWIDSLTREKWGVSSWALHPTTLGHIILKR